MGSVRPGRKTERVAKWIEREIKSDGRLEPEIIDPNELDLPFYNEAMSPFSLARNNQQYVNPKGRQWADKVGSAGAFIFVTPEYNHGYSGVIKNTIDWVGKEWGGKPALLVSHSWKGEGGSRAVEQLRQVLPEVGLIQTTRAVNIGTLEQKIDENAKVIDDGLKQYFAQSLNELVDLAGKLTPGDLK